MPQGWPLPGETWLKAQCRGTVPCGAACPPSADFRANSTQEPSTPPFLPGLPAQGPPSWCSPISFSLFGSFPPAVLGPAAVPCVAKPVLSPEHLHLSALVPREAGAACGQEQSLLLLPSSPREDPASLPRLATPRFQSKPVVCSKPWGSLRASSGTVGLFLALDFSL